MCNGTWLGHCLLYSAVGAEMCGGSFCRGSVCGTELARLSCRGVVFGTIYGGVIFPPAQAVYFPAPIVQVVVFGPVFAQNVFIGPSGSPYFCDTVFYNDRHQRIYNPCERRSPRSIMCCAQRRPTDVATTTCTRPHAWAKQLLTS